MSELTALPRPYIYFGGKAIIAPVIWEALGKPQLYLEPFFGGGATWLLRPDWEPGLTEVVNDLDGFIVNFWRAVQRDPAGVAEELLRLGPRCELTLEAVHRWLCYRPRKRRFVWRMRTNPEYYSVHYAARWAWGLCSWVGSGWCAGWWDGPAGEDQRPIMRGAPRNHTIRLNCAGQGVQRKRPHLGDQGRGVQRKRPHLGDQGLDLMDFNGTWDYIHALAARLASVSTCCGDWERICTDGATSWASTIGCFLDPPYAAFTGRDMGIYSHEAELNLTARVQDFCLRRQSDPRWRIILAGYEGEYDLPGWTVHAWKAKRCMGRSSGPTPNSENRHRERLWISPSCEACGQTAGNDGTQLAFTFGDGGGSPETPEVAKIQT